MCCRFFIEDNDYELLEIIAAAESGRMETPYSRGFEIGEVYPGGITPAITSENEKRFMLWGFPNLAWQRKPHINARCETVTTAKTFSAAARDRRCLIPASGYYEWKTIDRKHKEKYEFRLPDKATMYMAGIYSCDGRFAILTRDATIEITSIHDRMPVIIPKNLTGAWLYESPETMRDALTDLIFTNMDANNCEQEQMSLFS